MFRSGFLLILVIISKNSEPIIAQSQDVGSTITSFPYEAARSPNAEGGIISGVPRNEESPAIVLPVDSRINIQDQRLQYSHGFSDSKSGTSLSEQGSLLSTNEGWEYVIVKKGSYSYTSPEGIPVTVNYIADHNGFRIIP